MLFKDDWIASKERFEAFWEGEIIDRCCIAITAPRSKPIDLGIADRQHRDLNQQWLDPEYRLNKLFYECSNTFFGGESFPTFFNNLGPGVAASFLGCDYVLAEHTVWFDRNPIIKDWNKKPEIRFDEENNMWKKLYSMTEYFCNKSEDRYVVGISDIGGNFDIAVSLRGTQELLYDMYDNPEEVKGLISEIDQIWFTCIDKLKRLISLYQEGFTTWLALWSRDLWYPLQCDFSAMLSPEMFEEFVKPSLAREAAFLGKAIYHLDGPGQIPHLDHILEIEQIKGIEWVPMPHGNYLDTGSEQWYPLYKRIQDKGKKLVLRCIDPGKIEKLLENISPKGLFITTTCDTEDEAKELLRKVEKWSIR